ncbi:MAG: hypothetical protein LBK25_01875 [Treponema sp.]|jgi:hypothetical protein|nr:hypothetical protein [Treponema sp.]
MQTFNYHEGKESPAKGEDCVLKSWVARVFVLFIVGLVGVSCSSTNPYARVDGAVSSGDYKSAETLLEENKTYIYSTRNDRILYELDKGVLAHYAGKYDASIELLQNGEQDITEAYTQSITKLTKSAIVNDNSKNYDGEDYEDVYINAFNALNYYHKGDMEGAVVEIRRMNEKLAYLETKYSALEAQMNTIDQRVQSQGLFSSKFANSALGRYLGVLFYRTNGDADDARIDHDWLVAAYNNAPDIYAFPVPGSLEEELHIPAGKARLNILAFAGLTPVKQEVVEYIPMVVTPDKIKIALPELVHRPSSVNRIEVAIKGGQTFRLEQLEDVDAVVRETFKNKIALIERKTVIRSTIKGVTSVAAREAGRGLSNSDNSNLAAAGTLLNFAGTIGKLAADASEKADLRMSRYFPGKAYAGGMTLDPGVYSFAVYYYGVDGSLIESREYDNVSVKAETLNLVEAVCLK